VVVKSPKTKILNTPSQSCQGLCIVLFYTLTRLYRNFLIEAFWIYNCYPNLTNFARETIFSHIKSRRDLMYQSRTTLPCNQDSSIGVILFLLQVLPRKKPLRSLMLLSFIVLNATAPSLYASASSLSSLKGTNMNIFAPFVPRQLALSWSVGLTTKRTSLFKSPTIPNRAHPP